MVDDRLESLWSVFEDGCGNSGPAIKENSGFLVHYTPRDVGARTWMTPTLSPYVHVTQDFSQIARWLKCYLGDASWGWLALKGPPHEPHHMHFDEIQRHVRGSPVLGSWLREAGGMASAAESRRNAFGAAHAVAPLARASPKMRRQDNT